MTRHGRTVGLSTTQVKQRRSHRALRQIPSTESRRPTLPRHRSICLSRQHPAGPDPVCCRAVASARCLEQVLRPAAQLIEVDADGKTGQDVSFSGPRSAKENAGRRSTKQRWTQSYPRTRGRPHAPGVERNPTELPRRMPSRRS